MCIIWYISAIYYTAKFLIRAHRTSRVPMLRSAPRRPKSSYIDIYTFCLCFFSCFTKAVLHKAATFGNYPVCISIYKMISNLFYPLTDVRKQSCLSFLRFFCLALFLLSLSSSPCHLHPKREMQVELREFSKFSARYLSTKHSFKSDVNPKARIDVCWSIFAWIIAQTRERRNILLLVRYIKSD